MTHFLVEQVQAKYASVASSALSGKQAGVREVAEAFGYSPEELATIPAEANLGLSCGNPTAFASLRPGETVVDLGCGAGLDVLLAATKVGPTGKVFGIDMTSEMIDRARHNSLEFGQGTFPTNVAFHLARIDQIPLPESSADCVISNCVINLAPDKGAVFREIFRILKPGVREAISDIALRKELPAELAGNLLAYVGCIAGAISMDDYASSLRKAGFASVQIIDTGSDLNAYTKVENQVTCCTPSVFPVPSTSGVCCGTSQVEIHAQLTELLRKYDVNQYAASVRVYALKAES